jgi:tripartite-type tricarboxylate transporter receptor subunit TctC
MSEAGVKDFVAGTWVAVVAPPGTPNEITAKISRDIAEVIRLPEVQQRFAELGGEAAQGTQKELAAFLRDETARWKEVIQRANVSVAN